MAVKLEVQTTPEVTSDLPKAKIFPSSSVSPEALAAVNEDGDVLQFGGFTTQDYRLVKVTHIFQGTVTYTPASGVRALLVECWGAGGAGGGTNVTGANVAVSGGGGGGAYSATWSIALVSGAHTVAVGAGGTGVAGNNPGNGGGDTTFKDTAGTNICVAKGGGGGGGEASASSAIHFGGTGGAGGLASGGTGDIKQDGAPGGTVATGGGLTHTAKGANGFQSGGGVRTLSGSGNGSPATGYAGGGGGSRGASAGDTTGGAGGNGLIRVWEFA